jgi:hypothetical protein
MCSSVDVIINNQGMAGKGCCMDVGVCWRAE